jgi:hypothetical protein
MTPALLILSGAAVTIAAVLALISGVSFGMVAAGYLLAGLVLSALIVLVGALRYRRGSHDARYYTEVEAEMIALRESAALDGRFGSGSPEALSPVLHRTLMAREEAIERANHEDNDLLIRIRR